jgi:2-methylfumaryl-CoA isomerase
MYSLLNGMRVIEAASFIAAPSCALHLAQLGAEVIRIDQIGGGPDFRRWPLSPANGSSLYWEGLNKGKKSIAIDLSRPEGRELAVRLITAPGETGGLFVTNFPASGFLAYDRLQPLRPDLICVRVMGWDDGRQAVDYTVNSAIGVPLMTGPKDHAGPVNHVLPAWDLLTGAYAAFCLVSAERSRRDIGAGREIRLPLSDVAIATLGHLGQIAEVQLTGADRPRMGNDLFGAFGRDFATADGQSLMVVAITPRQWQGLVAILGIADAIATLEAELGVSFSKDEGLRFQHRERLYPIFTTAFASKTSADLIPAFERAGVCWGAYQSLHQAVGHDRALSAANPLLTDVEHPGGHYLTPGAAATLPGEARARPTAAPILGQDTESVLAAVLGLSSAEIGRLHDAGLVA